MSRRYWSDLLLTLLVIPPLAAAIYAVIMAYRTYHPQTPKAKKRPDEADMQFEEVRIPVRPGLNLAGWLIQTDRSAHTVVITHEWGSLKATKIRHAKFLYEIGYNVLLFDLRNHGDSDKDGGLFGMADRFTDDFEAAIRYVRNHQRLGQGRVGAISFSFSTYPGLYGLACRDIPVDALVLDSGPAMDIGATMRRFLGKYGIRMVPGLFQGPVMFAILTASYVFAARWMLGVHWPAPFGQITKPVFFVGSNGDDVIPWENVQPIARLVPGCIAWTPDGVAHLQAFRSRGPEYKQRVTEFFGVHLAMEKQLGELPEALLLSIGAYDSDCAGGCG